jgi:hypothetical protein
MKGQFTSSLSSFRFASTIKEEDLIALGLEPQDADAMVNMVQQMAQQKDGLNSFNWSELKPVSVFPVHKVASLRFERLMWKRCFSMIVCLLLETKTNTMCCLALRL